jgi:hypothetical protein
MDGKTIYRTLSPERTRFQNGIDRWPHLRKVPRRRWISRAHPMWFWGYSLYNILKPVPVVYGTKRLLWRPIKSHISFKIRIHKGLTEKEQQSRSLNVAVQGPDYCGPSLMHSFIQSPLLVRSLSLVHPPFAFTTYFSNTLILSINFFSVIHVIAFHEVCPPDFFIHFWRPLFQVHVSKSLHQHKYIILPVKLYCHVLVFTRQ